MRHRRRVAVRWSQARGRTAIGHGVLWRQARLTSPSGEPGEAVGTPGPTTGRLAPGRTRRARAARVARDRDVLDRSRPLRSRRSGPDRCRHLLEEDRARLLGRRSIGPHLRRQRADRLERVPYQLVGKDRRQDDARQQDSYNQYAAAARPGAAVGRSDAASTVANSPNTSRVLQSPQATRQRPSRIARLPSWAHGHHHIGRGDKRKRPITGRRRISARPGSRRGAPPPRPPREGTGPRGLSRPTGRPPGGCPSGPRTSMISP